MPVLLPPLPVKLRPLPVPFGRRHTEKEVDALWELFKEKGGGWFDQKQIDARMELMRTRPVKLRLPPLPPIPRVTLLPPLPVRLPPLP